jgi:hypothetical protein
LPRPKGALNRDNREGGLVKLSPGEILAIDQEVLDGMSKTNRMRLTHVDSNSLTLRQKQAAGAEYLASLVGHPEFRKRITEEALKDPVSVLKIASSERPKEVHLEADIQHSIVVVPTMMNAKDWEAQVLTLDAGQMDE